MHIPAMALFIGAILFALSQSNNGHSAEHIFGKLIQTAILLIVGLVVFVNVWKFIYNLVA
jgi:hypothetical protein